MKTLVLHDYFQNPDGGGKLCLLLAEKLQADLGFGYMDPSFPNVTGELPNSNLISLQCQSHLPLWKQYRLTQAFKRKTTFVTDYDTIIYSGSYAPLAVKLGSSHNVYYCHTPPRFLYDQYEFYVSTLTSWQRPLFKAFVAYFKPLYESAVQQMDFILTNSEHVQQRIQDYLQRPSSVVYPPCESAGLIWQQPNNYYLSTARLDPLKRVELIIKAFIQLPEKQLIVASGGEQLKKLKQLGRNAPNIRFTGWLPQAQLNELINHAIATIYLPRQEDFGISPLESMRAGKPVIGVAEGGLLETVLHDKTGILLSSDLTESDIKTAVSDMTIERAKAMRSACELQAQQFNTERFIKQIADYIATE